MIVHQFIAPHGGCVSSLSGCEHRLAEVAGGTTRGPGAIPLDFTNTHAHVVQHRLNSQGVAR
jgi:hypothetical protein